MTHIDVVVDRVWQRLRELNDRGTHLNLQWVPGHAGFPGNEMGDEVALAAANLSQDEAPVDLQSARARLRMHDRWEWEGRIQSTHYFQEVCPRRTTLGEQLGLSRRGGVETARLRTGHSTLQAGYRHRIGQQNDPTCSECGDEAETLGHLLNDCPAQCSLRRRVFGRGDPTMRDALGTGLAGGAIEAADVPLIPPPPPSPYASSKGW